MTFFFYIIVEKSDLNRERLRHELKTWNIRLINVDDDVDDDKLFVWHKRNREKYTAQLRLSQTRKLNQALQEELRMFMNKQIEDEGCLEYEELISGNDRRCFIRGVAGIGKTSLMEYIALKWAQKELFRDDEGNELFDFLFLIKCRELEELEDEKVEDFMKRKFEVDVKMLQAHGERVLIIVDGLDEDAKLEKSFRNDTKLRHLLKQDSSFLKGHATIISGRPHIESILNDFENLTGEYKRIEITGLSPEAVNEHIDVISNNNKEIADKIKQTISSSSNMSALATIPQYLGTLCYVVAIQGENEAAIDTMTPLYVWILASFWIQHVHDKDKQSRGAYEIFSDFNVVSFLMDLSLISFELLKTNKIVFNQRDFPQITIIANENPDLFSTFFTKKSRHRKPSYQFKHLTLHEFFAATHCMIKKIRIEEILKLELYEVARFIGGFTSAKGLADEEDIVRMYIECLENGITEEMKEKGKESERKASEERKEDGHRDVAMLFNAVLDCLERLPKGKGEFAQHYALGLFHEMFPRGCNIKDLNVDIVPRFQKVVGEPAFIYYSMTQIELNSVVHFIELLKSNNLQHKLSEITLRIRFASLTNNTTIEQLFKSLLLFKNVWFTYCEFSSYPWKMMDSKGQSPADSKLDHLYLNRCNMTEGDTKQLAHFIPFAEKVELIDLCLSDANLQELIEAITEEHANSRAKIRELKMNYCNVKGKFKKKFMNLKKVDVYIIK